MIPLDAIRAAAERIRGHVHRTPVLSSRSIGEAAGATVFLKCESLQKTGSFKPRGALNKVLSLEGEDKGRGLVTVSAGNHAQAVAWAARRTGVPCAVVMPAKAPAPKVEAVRGYGARIVFHDDNATLFDRLRQLQQETGYVFVHPFDDPVVLAGAGTAGLEIVEDVPDVSVVVVPVGGGGLMAGVASAVKHTRAAARVFAVELAEGPGLAPALAAGKPVPVSRPAKTLADGLIPPFVGAIPLEIARETLDSVVAVSEDAIADAMRFLLVRAKLYVEGGGAAAAAALLSGAIPLEKGDTVAVLVSGGNVDPQRFPFAPRA
jgi:threonine dehydratase